MGATSAASRTSVASRTSAAQAFVWQRCKEQHWEEEEEVEEEEGWGAKLAPICALAPSAEPLSIKGAGSTLARRQESAKAPGTQQGPPTPPPRGAAGPKELVWGWHGGVHPRLGHAHSCTRRHTRVHTHGLHSCSQLLQTQIFLCKHPAGACTHVPAPAPAPSWCVHTHAHSHASAQPVHAHTCAHVHHCKDRAGAHTHAPVQACSGCMHTH